MQAQKGLTQMTICADGGSSKVDSGELTGSFRGSLDHAAALEDAGYEVAT